MALEPALEKLIQNLKNGDDSTRVSAARELGITGTTECIPFLEDALSDSNFGVQASSENAIERIKKRAEQEAEQAAARAKKEAEEARLKEEAEKAEAARLAEEEEKKKKEIRIEELLSEEEIQKIKLEEIKKMEITKQQKTEELKRLEKQRLKDEEKKRQEEQRLEEEKRKKAEEMLREKIRAQAAEQKGLIEHDGEWITPEEMDRLKAEEEEAKKKKENSFKRLKMRKKKEHQSKLEDLVGQKEEGLIFLFNCICGGLGVGLILLILGFTLVKPLISISVIAIILVILAMITVLWIIYDNEKNIYKLRIYEVEDQEFTIKVKVSEKWLLKLMRTLVLKFNTDLNSIFAPKKKVKTKAEEGENDKTTPKDKKGKKAAEKKVINPIVLTVSEVTEEIKSTLEHSPLLSALTVKGELTGFVRSSSGHLYFSLKDEGAVINCVMFRSAAAKIKFNPENGQMVEVAGRIGLFEKRGSYQLYCYTMKPEGLGDLYLKFIKLKEKLEKQGYFEKDKKKSLPHAPARVGVITSLTGAAARDFFNVSRRRDPGLDIVFADALVQGEKAAQSVINALKAMDKLELDVIVVTRGGGAYEELMPFNDENMAMTIIACQTPVVAAIGHETDTVIAELVADLRAPTPSAAAELVSQNRLEIIKRFEDRKRALERGIMNILEMNRSNLRRFDIASLGRRLEIRLEQAAQEVDLGVHKIKGNILNRFQELGSRLEKNDALLLKLNPAKLLSRGYAWIEKPLLKTPVVSCGDVEENEIISVRLGDGSLTCHIDEIRKNKKRPGGS